MATDFQERTKRTPTELKNASKLLYTGMRYISEKLEFVLQAVHAHGKSEDLGRVISFHDAFLIDAMKLIVFFYSDPRYVQHDDCIAEDYFSDPDTWRRLRPERSGALERAYQEVAKLLAHFSYESDVYPSSKFAWNTTDIYVELFNTLQAFLDHVEPSLLYEPLLGLRDDNPQIKICRPVYPNHKGKNHYKITAPLDG